MAGPGMYFVRKQGLVFLHHVPAVLDHNGAFPQQTVAAGAARRIHIARNGKHIPPLIQGQLGGNEGAASGGSFHHHHTAGQAADDPVSPGKIPPNGRRARWEFRQQTPPPCHVPVQVPVGPGIHHIQSVAQHTHHRLLGQERTLHGQGVHTPRHTRHHQAAAFGNLIPHPAGSEAAVSRGAAGPHHSHRRLCVKVRQSPLII